MESSDEIEKRDLEELRKKMAELNSLDKSTSASESEQIEHESIKPGTGSPQIENDALIASFKADNNIMKGKLDRLQEVSAENLLLQSDAADHLAEIRDLRFESRELRSRCYDLLEENRQCEAEIRDLRRYIELLKSNKPEDPKQDLLNKIEYYQMEHERLMDEVRRLKIRVGEVSPRNTPLKSSSCKLLNISSNPYLEEILNGSHSIERGRSPVSNTLAASMASSLAADRINKDRSLSPKVALNYRDLAMDRYKQHIEEFERAQSMHSDDTETLLESHNSKAHHEEQKHCDDLDDRSHINHSSEHNDVLSESLVAGQNGLKRSSNGDHQSVSHSPISPHDFHLTGVKSSSPKRPSPNLSQYSRSSIRRSFPTRAFAPRSPADLSLGHSIKFTRPGGKISKGIVRYVGHLPARNEIYIGVELDSCDGKHSGTFEGTKYFSCPTNKGIFTTFNKVVMAWE